MFSKKPAVEVKCVCGHDVMLHGFQNMACSVMTDGRKCPCEKFSRP